MQEGAIGSLGVRLRGAFGRLRRVACAGLRQRVRTEVVLGAGELGQSYLEQLRLTGRRVRVLGVFDDRRSRVPAQLDGMPVLGGVEELVRFLHVHPVDRVVVALPWTAEARLLDCLRRLRGVPAELRLCPDVTGVLRPLAEPGPILVQERAMGPGEALVKNTLDRLLAALLLLFTGPLLLLIALAVKASSPGPVLYRQKRHGLGGRVFELLKFRTMRAEACEGGEAAPPAQTSRLDPRVTPLGRWLRRTSIDELPQLVNVLRGEMSLVGPRPHAVGHDRHYATLLDGYEARQRVRPGLTGWAQVNGLRGETETLEKMRRRVEHDLWYIRNRSLALDLRILLRTLLQGFGDPHAY
ncbi:exopolysaccharide biosynthesis polyprenyl glycosylphosphotransferase [Geminicoccaceae bacterium 1502E]|nr:exopolysaccharide biosynthesis polyprenyl glycosylphosphotransferase [Geminicoccaceae bacterium 1502E]